MVALGVALQAETPLAGVPLINGTQDLAVWNVPNDGHNHQFSIAGDLNVTVNEVGGQILISFTAPDGVAATSVLFAAAQAAGHYGASLTRMAAPGTTVKVSQNSALTGGASVVWADITGT